MRYEDVPSLATWLSDTTGRQPALLTSLPPPLPPLPPMVFKPGTPVIGGHRPPPLPKLPPPPQPPKPGPMSRLNLKPIDDLLDLFAKTYSPMAKANLLNDIDRAIQAWNTKFPGPLTPPVAALKEVVDRKLNLRASGSRYRKAICIAFHIYCNYDKANNRVHAESPKNINYYCTSANDKTDMIAKCTQLWKGIEAARSAIGSKLVADDDKTLKIFMAPEFYFRGKNGAYSPDVVAEIIPEMRRLGTASANYKDWLFVFGTAIAAIETEVTYCKTCGYGKSKIRFELQTNAPNPADRSKTRAICPNGATHVIDRGSWGAEVNNVALIQHGAIDHLIAKEYVSGIDYSGNKVTVHGGTAKEKEMNVIISNTGTYSHDASVHSDERMGGCIFTIDGITIGLEVCLDHALAGRGQPEYGRASALTPTIQVLLIPSYGMSIGTGLHCKPDGIAFNVDGRVMGTSQVIVNSGSRGSQPVKSVNDNVKVYGPFTIPA